MGRAGRGGKLTPLRLCEVTLIPGVAVLVHRPGGYLMQATSKPSETNGCAMTGDAPAAVGVPVPASSWPVSRCVSASPDLPAVSLPALAC